MSVTIKSVVLPDGHTGEEVQFDGAPVTTDNPIPVNAVVTVPPVTVDFGTPVTGQSLEAGGVGNLGWVSSVRKAIVDRLGEVTASPASNTVLARLKAIADALAGLPGSLGQKARTASLAVTLSTEDMAALAPATTVTANLGTIAGAATAAKQPALGTAGSASADVLTVQGIAAGVAMPTLEKSVPASPNDVHAPASNTAAVVTYTPAGVGVSHVIGGVVWSYNGDPTNGSIKIEDGAGNIVFGPHYITAKGPGFFTWPRPKKGAANTALIVTLAAGGAGVTGSVSVTAHWTE